MTERDRDIEEEIEREGEIQRKGYRESLREKENITWRLMNHAIRKPVGQ